jgi:DNA-binding HxlR family transcriptional regulator
MIVRRKSKVQPAPDDCPLSGCLRIIGGTWSPNIIWCLSETPRRFSELQSDIHNISPKVLTTRLRKLEADGVVHRKVMSTSPPTVEYSLTELGKELTPAIIAIASVSRRLKELEQMKPT